MRVKTSHNTKAISKLSLLVSLVLIINISNATYAEEKPLTTIGDPQLKTESSTLSSPFTTTKKETTKPKEKVTPSETPLKGGSPFTTQANMGIDPTKISPQQIIPKKAQPQLEELKGNQQGPVKSMIANPENKLGLAYPFVQLEKSKEMLKKKDLANAKTIVEPLSKWLTELTEYHIQLFKKLNNIDTAKNQAQVEKKLALDSALLRDKAYYQLALIYLGENKEKKAVKYLIEVIKSQPKTELGMKSYEILQQIGFTEKVRLIP